ncbi:MAG: c-type cytochrome, partial [Verrucomicrobiales bacterium]|nr:c-type cytochrome [Verrucomicrobiales bacterium]
HDVVLNTLVLRNPNQAAKLILKRLDTVKTAPEAASILQVLLNRREGAAAFERALGTPDVLTAASAKIVLQALNSIGRSDATLSPLLMKIAGINTALPAYTKAFVSNLAKAAATFGNAEEGKKVYEQAGCIACHTPGAANAKIGPDLSAISRGLPIDMIITEVVWPALNIKEGYEAVTITMKDGSVVSGFKQTETAEAIAVRDLATGAVRSIKRADTKEIKLGGTVMPDGLTATMNEQQLAHLVRYLSELGK